LAPATDGAPEGIEINFAEMKRRFYELMDLDSISGSPSLQVIMDHDLAIEKSRVMGDLF
jgi:hypothetical protein